MDDEQVKSSDGVELFLRSWTPKAKPRGVLVLVHGFKAHGGIFAWAALQFAKQGYAVYALDLRGHGRSGGEPLYLEKFDDYLADVDTIVRLAKERNPGVPVFLLGHSAGGVISSAYALQHQDELAGFICESFAQEVPAPEALLAAVRGVSRVAPRLGVFALKDEQFSRDPAFVDSMKHDPLISRAKYPSQTVAELSRAEHYLARSFPQMTMPVLILHGTADKVTKPHGSQLFFDTASSPDKTLKLYDGHVHDLLNDVGKENVVADVGKWMNAHLAS